MTDVSFVEHSVGLRHTRNPLLAVPGTPRHEKHRRYARNLHKIYMQNLTCMVRTYYLRKAAITVHVVHVSSMVRFVHEPCILCASFVQFSCVYNLHAWIYFRTGRSAAATHASGSEIANKLVQMSKSRLNFPVGTLPPSWQWYPSG